MALKRHIKFEDDCWIWTGAKRQGYGKLVIDGQHVQAHRWFYEQMRGPAPEVLHHECHNRACVNPWHLRDTTRALHHDHHPITHCKRGHLLDESNAYVRPDGHRTCRECKRTRARELYALDGNRLRARRRELYALRTAE